MNSFIHLETHSPTNQRSERSPLPQRAAKRIHNQVITPPNTKVSPKSKLPRVVGSFAQNKQHGNNKSKLQTPTSRSRNTANSENAPNTRPSSETRSLSALSRRQTPSPMDSNVDMDRVQVVVVPSNTSRQSTAPKEVMESATVNPSPSQDPPKDNAKELMDALSKLKRSSVSQDLTNFLEVFQRGMNDGINFLKEKITDPNSGLDVRVSNLQTDQAALATRVTTVESRVEVLEENNKAAGKAPQKLIGSANEVRLVNQLVTRTNDLEKRVQINEFQNTVLVHWADSMFHQHLSLQKQVDYNYSLHHANEVIIGGVLEKKQQDYVQAAKEFLEEKLNIEVPTNGILSAKRVGKHGKVIQVEQETEEGLIEVVKVTCPRHMVIKCTPKFRSILMENKKLLSGQVDPRGYKYFVSNYLPEAYKAAHEKHRDRVNKTYTKNLGKTQQNKTSIRWEGANLIIGGKVITGLVNPPAPGEVCRATFDYAPELASFDLLSTRTLLQDGNTFQGFTIRASKILAVFLAYCKVRLTVPNARHIMCAYDVAGVQDSCDDGEHYGGVQMAKMLQRSGLQNVVLFITRQTGPDKLGPKRFDIICNLTNELFQILENTTSNQPVDLRWAPRNLADQPPTVSVPPAAAAVSTTTIPRTPAPTPGTVQRAAPSITVTRAPAITAEAEPMDV